MRVLRPLEAGPCGREGGEGGEMKHHLMPSIVFLFKVKRHDIIGEGKGVY